MKIEHLLAPFTLTAALLCSTVADAAPRNHPACVAISARIAQEYPRHLAARLRSCSVMARAAVARGIDAPLTVELAWDESRFSPVAVNSRSGCSGILQASPKWWCPGGKREGCDLLKAGLKALAHYLRYNKDETQALCHFKAGSICNATGLRGAMSIMRRVRRLRFTLSLRGGAS